MAGSKALTVEQNERVRGYVHALLKQHKDQTELAPKLGITQPTLSGFLQGRSGTSYGVVEHVAKLLGKTEKEILGPATPASTQDRRALAAWKRRALAAELAVEDSVYAPAIKSVLDAPLRPEDEKVTTVGWVDRIRDVELQMLRDLRTAPEESGARPIPAAAEPRKKRARGHA